MDCRELICIGCPKGCKLTVEMNGKDVVSVTGNTCKNGDIYARKEVTNPTRIVTSIVRVNGSNNKMVSCKTETDIPKEKIMDCARALKNVVVDAPVKIGDILVKDVCGTGVNIVATSNAK